jgi:hypothetical protein
MYSGYKISPFGEKISKGGSMRAVLEIDVFEFFLIAIYSRSIWMKF